MTGAAASRVTVNTGQEFSLSVAVSVAVHITLVGESTIKSEPDAGMHWTVAAPQVAVAVGCGNVTLSLVLPSAGRSILEGQEPVMRG